ncbi:MAG: hypothetical protein DI596_08830 [Azospira oryzae]|nr:MAG: hypothetical protein DI596_08830 [Azospira oryzae]PZP79235.1 MAG: hypothetical protein DI593_08830 [Azospira oryzae]
MAVELMPILKALGPLVSIAERIVSSWMTVRTDARERDAAARLDALERYFTDQAKLTAELTEQVRHLAQALERQVDANARLERALTAWRIVAGAALGVATAALALVLLSAG